MTAAEDADRNRWLTPMPLFASPDVEKLKVRRDLKRLTMALWYHASHHRPKDVELACAAAGASASSPLDNRRAQNASHRGSVNAKRRQPSAGSWPVRSHPPTTRRTFSRCSTTKVLMKKKAGGFLKDEEAAEPVRAVGEHRHQHGRHELMLEAHSLFANLRPATGLAHNLEIVWDGIGTWQG